jgi:hypothetical protein
MLLYPWLPIKRHVSLSPVKTRHQENLRWTLDDLPGWQHAMLDESAHKRFIDAWVRIHDSGDFYSRAYLSAWLEIMRARQRTRFYAYTKFTDRR